MKVCRRSIGIAPPILNMGLDGGDWSTSQPGHNTLPGERNPRSRYPLNRRLAGLHIQTGHFVEEKSPCLLFSCRESSPGSSSPQPNHYSHVMLETRACKKQSEMQCFFECSFGVPFLCRQSQYHSRLFTLSLRITSHRKYKPGCYQSKCRYLVTSVRRGD